MDEYYLYIFESTHGAISTEKLLKPIGVVVMPVPRAISASCGIAIRIEPDKFDAAHDLFLSGTELSDNEYAIYHIRHDKAAGDFDYEIV